MSNNTVQPAVVIFDKDRAEACGVAPMYFGNGTGLPRDGSVMLPL